MKYIFLDTNIFYNNWHLENANFKYLFNYIENTDSILLVSELVCEEVENIRKRELETIVQGLKQEFKKAKKIISVPIEFDFDKLVDEKYNFKKVIQDKTSQIEYIDYQDVKQTEVVKRVFKKNRPFVEDEKGYRDTLIWLSFISYLSDRNIKGDVVFITNNKNDFYCKKGNDFHDDLKKDIEVSTLSCQIKTFSSLFDFIKSDVDKEEHSLNHNELNGIDLELEAETLNFINNIPENKFKEILENNQFREFPYINTILSHSIELMEGVEDPKILSHRNISNNTVYVSFRYNLRICVLNITIPSPDYYVNRQHIDKQYYEIRSEDDFTSFSSYVRTYLDVSFEYNTDLKTIDGFNIETINFK